MPSCPWVLPSPNNSCLAYLLRELSKGGFADGQMLVVSPSSQNSGRQCLPKPTSSPVNLHDPFFPHTCFDLPTSFCTVAVTCILSALSTLTTILFHFLCARPWWVPPAWCAPFIMVRTALLQDLPIITHGWRPIQPPRKHTKPRALEIRIAANSSCGPQPQLSSNLGHANQRHYISVNPAKTDVFCSSSSNLHRALRAFEETYHPSITAWVGS